MTTMTLPPQTLPLHDQYDVIVIGGGPAGCTAAAAAGRAGAKTLLIESCGFLGGAATAMLVPAWCPFSDKVEQIYCGLAGTVFERSKAGTWGVDPERLDWVPIDPEWLKVVYDELMVEHGVTVRFHTNLVHVEADQGQVQRIITGSKAGLEAWTAPVFIDCTGDADCAAWAGAAFQMGHPETGKLQYATLCFSLDNIDLETYRAGENLHPGNPNSPIYGILESGKYPEIPDKHMCNSPIGPSTLAFNAGHVHDVDNTDPDSVSRALPVGRRMTQAYRRALAEHVPGFEHCRVATTGAQIGIRETRRIVGDYMLTVDDWFARRTFDDEICRNAYFIDVHGGNTQQLAKERGMSTRYDAGEQHGIPYRCLCPQDLRNVLVAGRCISTDRTTQGSTRVMPVCLAMGEAAGIAAAQAQGAHGGDVHAVDTERLRADLRAAGAYLP